MELTPRELYLSELNRRYLQVGDTNEVPREKPTRPVAGDHWYDAQCERLCIWDGREWVEVPLD